VTAPKNWAARLIPGILAVHASVEVCDNTIGQLHALSSVYHIMHMAGTFTMGEAAIKYTIARLQAKLLVEAGGGQASKGPGQEMHGVLNHPPWIDPWCSEMLGVPRCVVF